MPISQRLDQLVVAPPADVVVIEQQTQHAQQVTLARAEAAVHEPAQVVTVGDGVFDLGKQPRQALAHDRREDVLVDEFLGPCVAANLLELDDKPPRGQLIDARQVEDVLDGLVRHAFFLRLRRPPPRGGGNRSAQVASISSLTLPTYSVTMS